MEPQPQVIVRITNSFIIDGVPVDSLPPIPDAPEPKPDSLLSTEAAAESQDCCSNSRTTTTRAFLEVLHAARPDQQLVFQLEEALVVAAGYHVTELKAVTYNTMDCGGVADQWEETVIQLWNPGDAPEREYMTVRKFLAIYEQVAEHIPVSAYVLPYPPLAKSQ